MSDLENPRVSFHVWIPRDKLNKFRAIAVEASPDERNWARLLESMIDAVHGNAKLRQTVVKGAKKND